MLIPKGAFRTIKAFSIVSIKEEKRPLYNNNFLA